MRCLGLLAALAVLLFAGSVEAQTASRPPTAPVSLDNLIGGLLQQGKPAQAEAMLAPFLRDDPKNEELLFLSGLVALGWNDPQRAIKIFRQILIDHPDAERVRLELARAFFVAKDYGNATRQFQFARAGHPPPAVAANIDRYLFEIRQAKSLSYSFDLALAPDTNLNAGSASREVTLYGLPFDLSDDARRRSGVGVATSGAVEWAPQIGPSKRLRLGASLQRRDYAGAKFDDMTAAIYAGPRIVTPHWDLSVLATGSRRWYGAKAYDQALGGRLTATYYPSPQLGLTTDISGQAVDYDTATYMAGPLVSIGESMLYALTPSSGVIARAGATRQSADSDPYSNTSGYLALGYFRDFPKGFSAYVEASASRARYDAVSPAFGVRRADTSWSAMVSLLNRHIVLQRFTPRLSYTYVRQDSTLPLYSFGRNRVELGLTTTF